MGALSIWHTLILASVVLLVFGGRGKVSDLMGDIAGGIRSFRKGLNEPGDGRTIAAPRKKSVGCARELPHPRNHSACLSE